MGTGVGFANNPFAQPPAPMASSGIPAPTGRTPPAAPTGTTRPAGPATNASGIVQLQPQPVVGYGQNSSYKAPLSGQTPLLNQTPEYGTYANFGQLAQAFGQQGQGALTAPDVTNSMAGLANSAAGYNLGQQNQQVANSFLQRAALGQTPSVADYQMQAGMEQAVANAQSQAASTRGNFGLANAQKNAMGTAANLGQSTANSAAQLRAQEIANAQNAYAQSTANQASQLTNAGQIYGQAAQGQEGQTLGYYGNQANNALTQEALAAQLAQSQGNLDMSENQLTQLNGAQDKQLAANTLQWAGNNILSSLNSAGGAGAAMSDENVKTDIGSAYGSDSSDDTSSAVTSAASIMGGKAPKANTSANPSPAVQSDPFASTTNDSFAWGSPSNGGTSPYSMPYDTLSRATVVDPSKSAMGQATNQPLNLTSPAAAQGSGGGGGGSSGGIMSMLGGLLSDERSKTETHSAEDSAKHPDANGPIWQQLDHFAPTSFRYRDPSYESNPEAAGAKHLGVIAQDVEQGPAGATLVKHAPNGVKMLDIPSMVGTLAAGAGALKRRGDEHEDRIARLESALGARR